MVVEMWFQICHFMAKYEDMMLVPFWLGQLDGIYHPSVICNLDTLFFKEGVRPS